MYALIGIRKRDGLENLSGLAVDYDLIDDMLKKHSKKLSSQTKEKLKATGPGVMSNSLVELKVIEFKETKELSHMKDWEHAEWTNKKLKA